MDTFTVVSIVTLIGFVALAAALLVPIYLFLNREEKATIALEKQRAEIRSDALSVEEAPVESVETSGIASASQSE